MNKLLLTIPAIYGDHHATAVRQILESFPGVKDIFISPAYHQVEIKFDPDTANEETIKNSLAEQGYVEGTMEAAYPTSPSERSTRHTETFGESLRFTDSPPAWQGRPLWPCPGLEYQISMEELEKEGVNSDGSEE
jgi:copper chaperone CopZ